VKTYGKLEKDWLKHVSPLDMPAYPPLPYFYNDATVIIFRYETDFDSAAKLLPPALEIDNPPIVSLFIADYADSTLGPYREVSQSVLCFLDSERFYYAVRLNVNSEPSLLAGREYWSFPKKLGKIDFLHNSAYEGRLKSLEGRELVWGRVEDPEPLSFSFPSDFNYLCLKLIPNYEDFTKLSSAQLVYSRWSQTSGQYWRVKGSLQIEENLKEDPYYRCPIRRILDCRLFKGTLQVSNPAKVIADL
jgi:acetoacetate decarboxylase